MSDKLDKEIAKKDLYEFLNLSFGATVSEIKKAYRKTAIKYHPDKNPSPKAAEKFHELSVALDILTNTNLRKQYDQLYTARKEQAQRIEKIDSARQKLKSDLEMRESQALRAQQENIQTKRKVEILKEQSRKRFRKNVYAFGPEESKTPQTSKDTAVQLKWKDYSEFSPLTNTQLHHLMQNFGTVTHVSIFTTGSSSSAAVVLFKNKSDAQRCVDSIKEQRYPNNDIFFEQIKGISIVESYESNSSENLNYKPYIKSSLGDIPIEKKISIIREKINSKITF